MNKPGLSILGVCFAWQCFSLCDFWCRHYKSSPRVPAHCPSPAASQPPACHPSPPPPPPPPQQPPLTTHPSTRATLHHTHCSQKTPPPRPSRRPACQPQPACGFPAPQLHPSSQPASPINHLPTTPLPIILQARRCRQSRQLGSRPAHSRAQGLVPQPTLRAESNTYQQTRRSLVVAVEGQRNL